ncbi:MAG: hypothetical protein HFF42_00730 [Lawsonibacter sp.]|jgi:hypothetical protein|nr:hypothetical protein [Lawsonibacter sp.]
MKNRKWIWKLLRLLGLAPFLFALGFCLVSSLLDSGGPLFGKMTFGDFFFMYSCLYWYTYVIGIILIVLSVIRIKKNH